MLGQNYNGMPNGRMIIACLKCGWKHDVSKLGWSAIVCQSCRGVVEHPIAGIKTSKTKGVKTYLMLSKTSRDLLHTIATTHSCSQSEALNMLMKFAADEYRAAGNTLMHNPKDKKHWAKELTK